MIQRDYIERLIQQVVQTLAAMLRLRESGETDRALRAAHETEELVLGPDHQLLVRMEATTLVSMVGRYELDRVRLYAVLVGEEGVTHDAAGDGDAARRCYVRALELLAAASLAGCRLDPADRERVADLAGKVDVESLEVRYRTRIARIVAGDDLS